MGLVRDRDECSIVQLLSLPNFVEVPCIHQQLDVDLRKVALIGPIALDRHPIWHPRLAAAIHIATRRQRMHTTTIIKFHQIRSQSKPNNCLIGAMTADGARPWSASGNVEISPVAKLCSMRKHAPRVPRLLAPPDDSTEA